MNNQRGFTLIELLVAIVIMISILSLSIVSFSNVSNNKKKESLEMVYEQAETAAKDFFSANEYRFDGLNNGAVASISLGLLVDEGYITTLSNPVTGKKLNYCDYVTIEKNNGKYDFKYKQSSDSLCSLDSITYNVVKTTTKSTTKPTSEPTTKPGTTTKSAPKTTTTTEKINAPELYIGASKDSDTVIGQNGWYKKIKPIVFTKDAKTVRYCVTNETTDCKPDTTLTMQSYSISGNGIVYDSINKTSLVDDSESRYTKLCFRASNSVGYASRCISYKIDHTPPAVKLYNKFDTVQANGNIVYYSGWINKDMIPSDQTQAVVSKSILVLTADTYSGVTNTIDMDYSVTQYGIESSGGHYKVVNKEVSDSKTIEYADYEGTNMAIYQLSDGVNKVKFKICDNAGNCTTPSRTVKFDITKPVLGYVTQSSGCSAINLTRDTSYGGNSYSYDANNILWSNYYTSGTGAAAYLADYSGKNCTEIPFVFLAVDLGGLGNFSIQKYNFATNSYGSSYDSVCVNGTCDFPITWNDDLNNNKTAMILMTVKDLAGNVSNPLRIRFRVK